jgi:7,8-dihydroneopterin aldolase/epimerase/oxygenase
MAELTVAVHRFKTLARIGVLPHELQAPQTVVIDITARCLLNPAALRADELTQVVDYRALRKVAVDETNKGHINLIETLASRIVEAALGLAGVVECHVRVCKPDVFDDCDGASITLTSRNLNRS